MATSLHRGQEVAIYESPTLGNVPSDDSNTYDANADRVHTVANLDISSIAQALLEDERSVDRIFERAGQMVKGLRNTELAIPVYLTGKDEVTADATEVTETALARLLEHCMGGITLGTSTTCKTAGAHSTTAVELTSSTGWAVGQVLGVIDADDTNSTVYLRRIEALSADVATLDQALPFTPADGDKIVATITITFDQDVLEDADAANRSHCVFIQKGASSTALMELIGGKASLSLSGLNRGELPTATLNYKFGTFRTSADDGNNGDDLSAISSTPAWSGTLHGAAPVSMGPKTKVYLRDYGTTTAASVHASNIEINPGVEITPVESTTSATDTMEGLATWSISKPAPTASMTIVPHTDEYTTDHIAGTYKAFRLERPGAEGKAFCIGMPRCEVSATPALSANGDVLATNISLRAHEDVDAIGTTDLAKSPMYIALA